MTVAGVDGCGGRWLVVTAASTGPVDRLDAALVDALDDLVADHRAGRLAALAVDMPIGLLEDRPRPADRAARAARGSRRSSVFPAPARVTLGATDYAEACERSRRVSGKALSKQTFHLLGPIGQLDRLLGPDDTAVVEAHPELAFARLDDDRPLPAKRSEDGRRRRIELLTAHFGPAFDRLIEAAPGTGLPVEDLLDATALVVTARHLVAGTSRHLGGEVTDAGGKRVQIVW
ncbi:MAG: DUF429 domain-containing protein [Actinomycetota bacterium]